MRALQATVAVLSAASLAGCGGGSVKKSDFIVRAEAICTNIVRATRSITPPSAVGTKRQQLDSLAYYLGRLAPIVQSEAAQLHALKRPSGTAGENAALARYLGALARSASDYRRLADAARQGDATAVAGAEAALRENPVASLATAYGLRACGNAGATVA